MANMAGLICMGLSAFAIVVLPIFGSLLIVKSESIEIEESKKVTVGVACYIATALYSFAFYVAYKMSFPSQLSALQSNARQMAAGLLSTTRFGQEGGGVAMGGLRPGMSSMGGGGTYASAAPSSPTMSSFGSGNFVGGGMEGGKWNRAPSAGRVDVGNSGGGAGSGALMQQQQQQFPQAFSPPGGRSGSYQQSGGRAPHSSKKASSPTLSPSAMGQTAVGIGKGTSKQSVEMPHWPSNGGRGGM